jgi:hypothetical protein
MLCQRKTPQEMYIQINKQEVTKARGNFPINMLMCKVDLSGVVTRAFSFSNAVRFHKIASSIISNLICTIHMRGMETAGARAIAIEWLKLNAECAKYSVRNETLWLVCVLEWGNKSARHHVGDLIGPRTESAVCALNQRHSGHISNLNLPFFSLRQRARRLRGLNLYQSAAPRWLFEDELFFITCH